MSSNIKSRFSLLLMLALVLSLLFTGCNGKQQTGSPSTPPSEEEIPTPVRDLVLSYIRNERTADGSIYFASDEPDAPNEQDLRIDSLVYAGETDLSEGIGVAYEIKYSVYWLTRSSKDSEGVYGWHQNTPGYAVLKRSDYDDSWDSVLGISYDIDQDKKVEDAILEVAYGLWDIDVSIIFDGYPHFVGPGSTYIPLDKVPDIDILSDYDPIYQEGDYWLRLDYKDLSALCYHSAEQETNKINNLETWRSDVATHRGIRIGMKRDEVLSTYPTIYDTPYWSYDGDYLWYCKNEEGFGAALLFWFQNDIVTKIELIHMFD